MRSRSEASTPTGRIALSALLLMAAVGLWWLVADGEPEAESLRSGPEPQVDTALGQAAPDEAGEDAADDEAEAPAEPEAPVDADADDDADADAPADDEAPADDAGDADDAGEEPAPADAEEPTVEDELPPLEESPVEDIVLPEEIDAGAEAPPEVGLRSEVEHNGAGLAVTLDESASLACADLEVAVAFAEDDPERSLERLESAIERAEASTVAGFDRVAELLRDVWAREAGRTATREDVVEAFEICVAGGYEL